MKERARKIVEACLQAGLEELMRRGLQMPGATCGMWGVCGAVSSMGAW